jgi:hypothetical protein
MGGKYIDYALYYKPEGWGSILGEVIAFFN